MLAQLTRTLFQHKKIFIPHVGAFEIKHHPAVLEFTERLIHAPRFEILFQPQAELKAEAGSTKEMQDFGLKLKAHLAENSFQWQGVGALEQINNRIVFKANPLPKPAPVAANKVLREKRDHAVLVGDTERSSMDTSYNTETKAGEKRFLWIGWLLVLLALLFIGFLFYKKAIHPGASQFPISYHSAAQQIKQASKEIPVI